MKVEILKGHGGVMSPATSEDAESLQKLRTGQQYTVDIKQTRNPQFHSKVFVFFEFCFNYWRSDREFMDEKGQKEVFRKHLTCLAGFYESHYNIKGEVRIEAKSLSYGNMEQEEFEKCYLAIFNAASNHIFKGCDSDVEARLMSFI